MDDHLLIAQSDAKRRKLEILSRSVDGATCDYLRQLAWIQKDDTGVEDELWRPPKVHRMAAKHWLQRADNQIRVSTVFKGWKTFQFDGSGEEWQDPYEYPRIAIAIDLGGDGLCACNALLYKYDVNAWVFPDLSHMIKCQFQGVMKAVGLWNFVLLLLITLNLEYGPYTDETRRGQLSACMKWFYTNRRHDRVPLFTAAAPAILEDVARYGLAELPGEDDAEAELYSFLRQRSRNPVVGRRISMVRFGAFYNALKKALPWWRVMQFERTLLALETDVLKGKAFRNSLTTRLAEKAQLNDLHDTTSVKRLQIQDKTLRDVCANAVAVSVVTLSDPHHHRVSACIVTAGKPAESWHTNQNKKLRSAEDTAEWMIQEVSRRHIQYLNSFWALLCDPSALQEASFYLPGRHMPWGCDFKDIENFDLAVIVEDELADIYGQLLAAYVTQDVFRMLWLIAGWPVSVVQCLDSGVDSATKCIERFAKDKEIFEEMCGLTDLSKDEKPVLSRHLFHTRPVKQLVECFRASGYTVSPQLRTMLTKYVSGCLVTQLVEDINGVQKNSSQLKACKHHRKEATLMAHSISSDYVTERHHFLNPPEDAPAVLATMKLADDSWSPEKDCSIDITELATTKQQTPWFSPGPHNFSLNTADEFMLRDLKSNNRLREMSNAWMGELVDVRHHLIIGFLNAGSVVAPAKYYHALYYWPSSGVFLWEVEVRSIIGTPHRYIKHLYNKGLPVIRSITSLSSTRHVANTFKWRSWLWQTRYCPEWARTDRPAVRPFLDLEEDASLLKVACLNAFWGLGRTTILKFAKVEGIVPPEGSDLFNVLWFVLMAGLEVSEEQVLAKIHRRLVQHDALDEVNAVLLDLDDCSDVLERTDVDAVKKEKQAVQRREASGDDFEKQYLAKARAVYPAPKGKPKAKPKAKAGAAPPAMTFTFETSQAEAKLLLPADASIWRDRTRGGWCGHLPPNPRISAMFSDFPSQGHALQHLLRTLWEQHFRKFGLTKASCPVTGLW